MKDREFAKTISINGDWAWGTQFAGIKMASNYFVFHLMSKLLSENPHIQKICEIGTHTGSMAVYLGLEGLKMGGVPVHTFEKDKQVTRQTSDLLEKLKVEQHIYDVGIYPDKVIAQIKDQPTYLVSDGGNKVADANVFLDYLPSGSILSLHDYSIEVLDSQLGKIYEKCIPIRPYEWNETNAQFASFKVK